MIDADGSALEDLPDANLGTFEGGGYEVLAGDDYIYATFSKTSSPGITSGLTFKIEYTTR